MVDRLMEFLNIDASTFWTLAITGVIPLFIKIWTSYVNARENKYYTVPKKVESDFFYVIVMAYSIGIGLLISAVHILFDSLGISQVCVQVTIIIVLVAFAILYLNDRKFIKTRILSEKRKWLILLIDMPSVLFSGIVFLGMFVPNGTIFSILLALGFIICEVIGLLVFDGRYTKYEYSNATIRLKTGEDLLNVKVQMMSQSSKWLVIKKERSEKRIKLDEIISIEYYGEPVIVMREQMLEILKRYFAMI